MTRATPAPVPGRALRAPAAMFDALETALKQAGLGVGAADLHGSLAGWLCGGGAADVHGMLRALALDGEEIDGDLHARLHALVDGLAAELRAHRGVRPLVPAAPLAARADALVDWCRGFLGGLGLAGIATQPQSSAPRAREPLADLGRIATAHLACDADDGPLLDAMLEHVTECTEQLRAVFAMEGAG